MIESRWLSSTPLPALPTWDDRAAIRVREPRGRSGSAFHRRPYWPVTLARVSLNPTARDVLVIVALSVAVLSLLVALWSHIRVTKIRRRMILLQGRDGTESFVDVVSEEIRAVQVLRQDVAGLHLTVDQARADVAAALRHVGVVRYDAFNDMGGRMSFSAAMLDDAGNGMVITSIHGRTESRTYLKSVNATKGENLSPEEVEVVADAARGLPGSRGR